MNPQDLAKEFPRDAVHWRVQGKPYERDGKFKAMALAYIDARDVMDRLDEVCGPSGWQDEYTETAKGRIICRLGVFINDGKRDPAWVWKSDGAGETAVEGDKGGISDALKRAAVHWGIGRYLYRLDSPWVFCKVNQKNGNTYWKEWAEDPWTKVKTVGYSQPTSAAESVQNAQNVQPETNRDPRKIADGLIRVISACETYAKIVEAKGGTKFSEALQWLDENDKPKANEVTTAIRAAEARVSNGQAPQEAA